jgi:hypothetical protein
MKTLTLLAAFAFLLGIASCKQNSPAPATPSPAPAPTTPTTTPTPTTPISGMTATEAALVGDWIWDKSEVYSSGNISQIYHDSVWQIGNTIMKTLYAGSHMVLKSSFYNGTATTSTLIPQYYNGDFYSGYGAASSMWYISKSPTGEKLFSPLVIGHISSTTMNIITLNSTTLVLQDWLPGQIPNGGKSYWHK